MQTTFTKEMIFKSEKEIVYGNVHPVKENVQVIVCINSLGLFIYFHYLMNY